MCRSSLLNKASSCQNLLSKINAVFRKPPPSLGKCLPKSLLLPYPTEVYQCLMQQWVLTTGRINPMLCQ
jgi:hypothetical protein